MGEFEKKGGSFKTGGTFENKFRLLFFSHHTALFLQQLL
jgi:hypothetical protein